MFMREIQNWAKHEQTVELKDMLQGELHPLRRRAAGPEPDPSLPVHQLQGAAEPRQGGSRAVAKATDRWYVPDPSKQIDLEKLREKSLLSEFEDYKNAKGTQAQAVPHRSRARRLQGRVRRAGLQDHRQRRAKLPENVLQEDEKLLMYYDVASMRLGMSEVMLQARRVGHRASTMSTLPRRRCRGRSGARATCRVWLPRGRLCCALQKRLVPLGAASPSISLQRLSFVSAARPHRRCSGARRACRAPGRDGHPAASPAPCAWRARCPATAFAICSPTKSGSARRSRLADPARAEDPRARSPDPRRRPCGTGDCSGCRR